jgi:single-strand DNA-binding protein
MSDTITLTGLVASDPRSVTTAEGLAITSFRLASNQRRFDRSQDKWVDGETNWYTVTTFRQLAANASVSIKKGERILVAGRLRVREWEAAGGKKGTNVDVEADALGHDLTWGTAAFSRGGGAATSDPFSTTQSAASADSFPTEAQLEAIVDGAPTSLVPQVSNGAANSELETPF